MEVLLAKSACPQRIDLKPIKKKQCFETKTIISYRGKTIVDASKEGNLPLCVLLWGIAATKSVNLMLPDNDGNYPIHHACLADTPEVKCH